jgi:hypothetical protein
MKNMTTTNHLATRHLVNSGGFSPQNSAAKSPFGGFPAGDLAAAREARKEKLDEWAAMTLRQDFADEAWMRDHIKAAGVRAPNRTEPATVNRLRNMLRRAKVTGAEIRDCVGTSLVGFLKLNPLLPLWAALALVLESIGRFTRAAAGMAMRLVQRSCPTGDIN